MKLIVFLLGWVLYAYIAINMIIDIKSFGDFIWFAIVGSVLLALFRLVISFIVAIIPD